MPDWKIITLLLTLDCPDYRGKVYLNSDKRIA